MAEEFQLPRLTRHWVDESITEKDDTVHFTMPFDYEEPAVTSQGEFFVGVDVKVSMKLTWTDYKAKATSLGQSLNAFLFEMPLSSAEGWLSKAHEEKVKNLTKAYVELELWKVFGSNLEERTLTKGYKSDLEFFVTYEGDVQETKLEILVAAEPGDDPKIVFDQAYTDLKAAFLSKRPDAVEDFSRLRPEMVDYLRTCFDQEFSKEGNHYGVEEVTIDYTKGGLAQVLTLPVESRAGPGGNWNFTPKIVFSLKVPFGASADEREGGLDLATQDASKVTAFMRPYARDYFLSKTALAGVRSTLEKEWAIGDLSLESTPRMKPENDSMEVYTELTDVDRAIFAAAGVTDEEMERANVFERGGEETLRSGGLPPAVPEAPSPADDGLLAEVMRASAMEVNAKEEGFEVTDVLSKVGAKVEFEDEDSDDGENGEVDEVTAERRRLRALKKRIAKGKWNAK